jgi:enoyl-CoA hydratase
MITTEVRGPAGIVTLDRPEARNALTGSMIRGLADALAVFDADDAVRAIVLTGRDPAFCAGLDLADLAATFEGAMADDNSAAGTRRGLLPSSRTPRIGAVNGAAVTGGLELALGCDFLIASERATFADTHARVGVMPGGGMTIRLPQAVGAARARQMSMTGNFIDAATACSWGLVNEVVEHAALLERAVELAGAIADADAGTIAELRTMYDQLSHRGDEEAFAEEARWSKRWMKERFSTSSFETRRSRIIERGSSQQ